MLVQVVATLTSAPSEPIRTSWDGLRESLATIRPEPVLWRPGIGDTRRAASITEVHALVLDYDRHTPLARIQRYWAPWACAVHATKSATRTVRRWRAVIPLAAPVAGADWRKVYGWARSREPMIDRSCSDPSRCWWSPIRGSWWHAESWDGPALDLDLSALADPLAPPPKRRRVVIGATPEARQRDRLKSDPVERGALGVALGGRLSGGCVRNVPCPSCNRRSVWWPVSKGWARCDHQHTCGWFGPADKLVQEKSG